MNKENKLTVYFPDDFKQEVLAQQQQNRILFVHGGTGTGKTCLLQILVEIFGRVLYVPLQQMESYDEVVKTILPVFSLKSSEKIILILDNIDALLDIDDGEGFFRFEREVLLPIVEEDNVDVIATSSLNIRSWREFEVRDCVHSITIPSLGNDALKTWAERIDVSFDRAMTLTLGYPLMMAWLEQEPDIEQLELCTRFVDHYLKNQPEKEKEFMLKVSLFPVFNIDLLEKVFEKEDCTYGDFVEKLRPMTAMGLITWHSAIGAYTFQDNRVRRFFAKAYRYQNMGSFREANKKAKNIFEDETRYVSYLDYSLPGFIYHFAISTGLRLSEDWSCGDKNEKIGAEVIEWLKSQFPNWQGADWQKIYKIWLQEEGDQEFVKEMKQLLSVDAFDTIAKLFVEAI